MKVLMAHMGMGIGGAETHVLELCKALARRGVTVFVASGGGVYEAELTAGGVTHIHAPLQNRKPLNMLRAYRVLKRTMIDNDIHILHAHARIPAFICGLLQRALRLRGHRVQFVTTAHLNFNTALPYKLLTNWGQATLAVSDDIKPYLMDNYRVSPERIIVTMNGVDTEKFCHQEANAALMEELKLDAGKRRVVSISRMDADRSLAARALIACAAELPADIEIILVGGGNDYERVAAEAEAANAKLNRRAVIMTGGRTDINRLVQLADIFVNVSRAALEAMACGVPTIVAGNQGYLGIFDASKLDAALATNFCARGMAETTPALLLRDLTYLLNLPGEELAALGAYGRKIVCERYSVGRMAEDALVAYKRSANRPDAALSGYYGFRNHGDDTLLAAIIRDLRALKPDIDILVLSKRPKETRAAHGVRAVNRLNLPAVWRVFRKKPLLISGGGTLIQDGTSTQSLLYYLYIIHTALRHGCKAMLYANGMGPLARPANRCLAARVLSRVNLITLRDEESAGLLSELAVSAPPVAVTADPAFGEPADAPAPRDAPYFCVSVRDWKTLPEDFDQRVAAFCDQVYARHGLSAAFVVMQPQNDEELTRRIMRLTAAPAFKAEGYAVGETVAGAAFVAAMRLHTAVYAARAGVPMIGLVYDPKVAALMGRFRQPYVVDVSDVDAGRLAAFADEIMAGRAEIAAAVLQKAEELRRLAKHNAELAVGLMEEQAATGRPYGETRA